MVIAGTLLAWAVLFRVWSNALFAALAAYLSAWLTLVSWGLHTLHQWAPSLRVSCCCCADHHITMLVKVMSFLCNSTLLTLACLATAAELPIHTARRETVGCRATPTASRGEQQSSSSTAEGLRGHAVL
jgi:hypothetical protein